MKADTSSYRVGDRVVVTQQIPQRDGAWTIRTEGRVVGYGQRQTGSWYAHSKGDKLWLDRLTLRTDDGETVVCSLDCNTRVEVVPGEPGEPGEREAG